MNLKSLLLLGLVIISSFAFTYSNQDSGELIVKKPRIYNFDNEIEFEEFVNLKLDKTHENLLDPQVSKSEIADVMQSWRDLHRKCGEYLKERSFDWGVESGTVSIFQKIYFDSDGSIENYFFKVQNEDISFEKKEEFSAILETFCETYRIKLQRNKPFAQCGKTRY